MTTNSRVALIKKNNLTDNQLNVYALDVYFTMKKQGSTPYITTYREWHKWRSNSGSQIISDRVKILNNIGENRHRYDQVKKMMLFTLKPRKIYSLMMGEEKYGFFRSVPKWTVDSIKSGGYIHGLLSPSTETNNFIMYKSSDYQRPVEEVPDKNLYVITNSVKQRRLNELRYQAAMIRGGFQEVAVITDRNNQTTEIPRDIVDLAVPLNSSESELSYLMDQIISTIRVVGIKEIRPESDMNYSRENIEYVYNRLHLKSREDVPKVLGIKGGYILDFDYNKPMRIPAGRYSLSKESTQYLDQNGEVLENSVLEILDERHNTYNNKEISTIYL